MGPQGQGQSVGKNQDKGYVWVTLYGDRSGLSMGYQENWQDVGIPFGTHMGLTNGLLWVSHIGQSLAPMPTKV